MSANISSRIKERRKELGLSADEVAKRLHISRASYYRYESKEVYNLPITILQPLAEVLNTTADWLMGWDNDNLKSEEEELIAAFRNLPEAKRKQILEFAAFLVKSK